MYLHTKRCLNSSVCRQIKVIYFGTEGVYNTACVSLLIRRGSYVASLIEKTVRRPDLLIDRKLIGRDPVSPRDSSRTLRFPIPLDGPRPKKTCVFPSTLPDYPVPLDLCAGKFTSKTKKVLASKPPFT